MNIVNEGVHWPAWQLLHLRRHTIHNWHLHSTEGVHVHHRVILLLLLVLKKLLPLPIVHTTNHSWVGLLQVLLILRASALKVGLLGREIGQILSQLFAVGRLYMCVLISVIWFGEFASGSLLEHVFVSLAC